MSHHSQTIDIHVYRQLCICMYDALISGSPLERTLSDTFPADSGLLARSMSRRIDRLILPEIIDFWTGHVNALWSRQRLLARVVARRIEARGVVTLVLQPNRHWPGHAAGQHINVSAEVNGRRLSRSYSLSGVGNDPSELSITVKRVAGGALSHHLCDQVRVGDVLALGQPFGKMTWPEAPSGHWLFLSAGSGITPFMGLIQAMRQSDWPVQVQLIHWAGQRSELCFKQALDEMVAIDSRLKVQWMLTREGTELQPNERAGRLSTDVLTSLCPALATTSVRACGPAGFVAMAREATLGAADFMAEAFSPAPFPSSSQMGLPGTQSVPTPASRVKVQLTRTGRTVELPTDRPLLQGLREQGINPPSGCGMGICHTCVCTKQQGSVSDSQTGQRQDEPGLPVRLCVSHACSDLSLEL